MSNQFSRFLHYFKVQIKFFIFYLFSKQKLETLFRSISHRPQMNLYNPKKYNLIGKSANNILLLDLKSKQFLGIFPHDDIILKFYSIHRRSNTKHRITVFLTKLFSERLVYVIIFPSNEIWTLMLLRMCKITHYERQNSFAISQTTYFLIILGTSISSYPRNWRVTFGGDDGVCVWSGRSVSSIRVFDTLSCEAGAQGNCLAYSLWGGYTESKLIQ